MKYKISLEYHVAAYDKKKKKKAALTNTDAEEVKVKWALEKHVQKFKVQNT